MGSPDIPTENHSPTKLSLMSSKTVKVYRVQIEPPVQPFLSVKRTAQRVENALSQGSSAVRYGRIWRVGKVEHDGNVLIGKLGFVNRPKTSEVWNEDKLDFQEFEFEGGASSTFAVNLDTLKLAIQPTTNVPVTSALGLFVHCYPSKARNGLLAH